MLPSVSLKALLEDEVPAELIEDRIVLIGYVDLTDRNADYWYTPHGGMPGVFVQGQMTSQLISAALDDRALIRWLSLGQELLWLAGWAMAGGIIIRQAVRIPRLIARSRYRWRIALWQLLWSHCIWSDLGAFNATSCGFCAYGWRWSHA